MKTYKEFNKEEPKVERNYWDNGQKKSEKWYLNDKIYEYKDWIKKLKKIGSPHYEEQKILAEQEFYQGRGPNPDAYAFINPYIKYYDNGQKKSELWSLNGKYHKEDGPAYQSWYKNGQKKYEYWYLDGKLHREDGPAYQDWYENEQKRSEKWYLKGKNYSREEWINQLKKISSPHYEDQKMLLDIEKYNL